MLQKGQSIRDFDAIEISVIFVVQSNCIRKGSARRNGSSIDCFSTDDALPLTAVCVNRLNFRSRESPVENFDFIDEAFEKPIRVGLVVANTQFADFQEMAPGAEVVDPTRVPLRYKLIVVPS